ncbi:Peptidoglycan-binding (PGRP) domain of peptidoglycan hydrolases-containing protein [Nakamurella panacisegetis]|uniref:Peptidoglycan-binding (PGRP) domain of peptidoglycan hydrolases-containing protein n=1 Tax=Nakamurella panacisegetis TaxID=1090615 RepID=A0A1H0R9J9_9ACTN|nr:peptidoglycan-binding protein [Nakamurella panacisegetis]SDP25716.1 Peptidoglycan-binding (PGRP) domain of peptidoglycan hydrolases-containing protein [Nakamurella panacisegetis]
MKIRIRTLFGVLALAVGLVFAVPSAAASSAPAGPGPAVVTMAQAAGMPNASGGDDTPAPLPAWPVVRRGSVGQPVRTLQYLLDARGATLAVDGIFGPRTDAAVRSFQSAHGLVVDGIVGPRTWRSVIITVRYGSVGSAVKAVQDQANFRGGREWPPVLVVDGVFGSRTRSWVTAFQTVAANDFGHLNVTVDGVVGPVTWRLLISGYLSG